MAREDNSAVVREFFRLIDQQEWDAVTQLLDENYMLHMAGNPQPMNSEAFVGFAQMFLAAMPDLTHSIDALISEGETVAVRLTVTGTHQHELMGVPGSGRSVQASSFNFYRISEGRIAEQWINFDMLGLLQQIGALASAA